MTLLLLPCFAVGSGCAQPPPAGDAIRFDPCSALVLTLQPEASEAEAAGIKAGIALWNQAARARLSLQRGIGTSSGATLPVHFQAAAAPSHGFYDPERGEIFINTDLDPAARAITIAHELGHAFGLGHIAAQERTSVMNTGNMDTPPTPEDTQALAALWGYCPTVD